MPEAYLAQMALDIIEQQPYLVAGHEHTIGAVCPRDHHGYFPGWSFVQTEKQEFPKTEKTASDM